MCWALAALLVLVPGAPGRCLAQSDRNSSVSTHQGAVIVSAGQDDGLPATAGGR